MNFSAMTSYVFRKLTATILSLVVGSLTAIADRPPNIILFLADDLGYGELGCYGQKLIQTPHLDRMAAEGMRFTQFYAGSPVCAPSRSVLMTGQHAGHTRVRGNAGRANREAQALRPEDRTVAEILQRAGYATALIGKWGLGHEGSAGVPTKKGFEYFFGYLDQTHAHNPYPEFLLRNEERVRLKNKLRRTGQPYEEVGAGSAEEKVEFAPDLLASDALRWIEENKERPFFLFFSTIVPHANNEATKLNGNGQEVPDFGPYTDMEWPDADRGHAAAITRMDRDLGRMLELLKRLQIDEQTLVIFSSDNGHHKEGGNNPDLFDANGPLRGKKRDLYEGGIRVPTLARWPGHVKPATVSSHVGCFTDFFATAAELAAIADEPSPDSISFAPTLQGEAARQKTHKFLYWEFHENGFSQAALMDGRWKAVCNKRRDAPLELYDLTNDLGETHNIAAAEPVIAATLRDYLLTARTDSADWPLKDPR